VILLSHASPSNQNEQVPKVQAEEDQEGQSSTLVCDRFGDKTGKTTATAIRESEGFRSDLPEDLG
jgi:hypothetical protein